MILTRQKYKNIHVTVIEIFQKKKKKSEYARNRYKDIPNEKNRKLVNVLGIILK